MAIYVKHEGEETSFFREVTEIRIGNRIISAIYKRFRLIYSSFSKIWKDKTVWKDNSVWKS